MTPGASHAHQVEAYLGLVPREWGSGEGQIRDVRVQTEPFQAGRE
jgi:transposase